MQITVRAQALSGTKADVVAIPLRKLEKSGKLPAPIAAFDRAHGGAIAAAVERGDFAGKANQAVVVHPTGKGAPARALLLGLG